MSPRKYAARNSLSVMSRLGGTSVAAEPVPVPPVAAVRTVSVDGTGLDVDAANPSAADVPWRSRAILPRISSSAMETSEWEKPVRR